MDNLTPITPLEIMKPSLGEQAGFLFGLLPVGKALQRHQRTRIFAELQANSNRPLAYATLERLERLLVWAPARSRNVTRELEAIFHLHAQWLREEQRHVDAARVLLTARQHVSLTNHADSLFYLAEILAQVPDHSETAIRLYIDVLVYSARNQCTAPAAVTACVQALAIPSDPLADPSPAQRAMIKRLGEELPNEPLVEYGMLLSAFHDGRHREVQTLAKTGKARLLFPVQTDYLVQLASAELALDGNDFAIAYTDFQQAYKLYPEHTLARRGLVTTMAAWGKLAYANGEILPGALADRFIQSIDAGLSALTLNTADLECAVILHVCICC